MVYMDLKSCGTYTPVPVRFRSAALLKKWEKRFKINVSLTFLSVFILNTIEHLFEIIQEFLK